MYSLTGIFSWSLTLIQSKNRFCEIMTLFSADLSGENVIICMGNAPICGKVHEENFAVSKHRATVESLRILPLWRPLVTVLSTNNPVDRKIAVCTHRASSTDWSINYFYIRKFLHVFSLLHNLHETPKKSNCIVNTCRNQPFNLYFYILSIW